MPEVNHSFSPTEAERLARLTLRSLFREYPNHMSHLLGGECDVAGPRELTPAFFGCFDWHSAVHGHWSLSRLARFFPNTAWNQEIRAALARSLTPEHMAGEVAYLSKQGREGFERPYGLAWLLQLAAELREWSDAQAEEWSQLLRPLEELAVDRFIQWLPKLMHPVRSGEHSQTAFAMGLALDWSRTTGERKFETLLRSRAIDFHQQDRGWSFGFEPSGHDFLSPGLAEADLMRRVFEPADFEKWLSRFLPELTTNQFPSPLKPVIVTDSSDGKLSHLEGLNLSRAWMLEGIASALSKDDPRMAWLKESATEHRRIGLAAVTGKHYAGGHWLGSFAVYLLTQRGIAAC